MLLTVPHVFVLNFVLLVLVFQKHVFEFIIYTNIYFMSKNKDFILILLKI